MFILGFFGFHVRALAVKGWGNPRIVGSTGRGLSSLSSLGLTLSLELSHTYGGYGGRKRKNHGRNWNSAVGKRGNNELRLKQLGNARTCWFLLVGMV